MSTRLLTADPDVISMLELFKTLEHKEETFECPKHGTQTYTTYRKSGDEWAGPYCPECRRETKEQENLIASITTEAVARATRLRDLLGAALPLDYEDATFGNYVPETQAERKALLTCRRFAERFLVREIERERKHDAQEKGWREENSLGLALLGNYGTGKTHLAYAILKTLDALKVPGYYTTVTDLFDRLNDRDRAPSIAETLAKLTAVSCLVLDEIGVQTGSESERRRLYQIIDGRLKAGRPTIFISNLSGRELNSLLTERVMDRVKQSSYVLTFDGRSRRSAKTNKPEDLF